MKLNKVVIESPYAGNIDRNTRYLKLCMLDCLRKWEAPYASHLIYTQILDDSIPEERELWMKAGFVWWDCADKTVVYTDLWISNGMKEWIKRSNEALRPVEYRKLSEDLFILLNENVKNK